MLFFIDSQHQVAEGPPAYSFASIIDGLKEDLLFAVHLSFKPL